MRFSFIPKEEKFFDLFEESAKNLVDVAGCLKDLFESPKDVGGQVAHITELEHVGDRITHKIIARLHRTFVTPFDREDIAQIAHNLDDIVDLVHAAADAILIYRIDSMTARGKELAEIIYKATIEITKALPLLRERKNLKKLLPYCVELNRLENDGDRCYRAALGELFDDSPDMTHIMKWREIYENMESATDRCEDIANVLEGVALKHA
jgi:predicted phosphate transport protein (TIGR00153 family)